MTERKLQNNVVNGIALEINGYVELLQTRQDDFGEKCRQNNMNTGVQLTPPDKMI